MKKIAPIDYKSVLSLFLPSGTQDYFDITEASDMGGHNAGLGEHFRREGYAPRCRSFTPRQVGIIVECIGKPYE